MNRLLALALVLSSAGCGAMDFMASKEAAPASDAYYAEGEQSAVGGAAPATPEQQAPAREPFGDEDRLLARLDLDDEQPKGPPQGRQPNGGNQGGGAQNGGQGGNQGGGGEAAPVPPLPLLIYSAELNLAVYEVGPTQRAVIQHARELGGFLSRQSDLEVIVRVPARRFQDALERIERVGDVLHKDVQALDVSEEYRDLSIRLRNAEVVRARLETLLEQAKTVEDALKVQKELGSVTETIETIKGRLRFLQDRIAFSTITVRFAPREATPLGTPDVYRLPFPWLDELGLHSLLNMGR